MQRSTDSTEVREIFDIHQTLVLIATKNHPYYLDLFKEKRYSLILRKACYALDLELIELLLRCKHLIRLEINATSSNQKTALDWAFDSDNVKSGNMSKVITLLLGVGAKTGAELCDEEECEAHCDDDCDVEFDEESEAACSDECEEIQEPTFTCRII